MLRLKTMIQRTPTDVLRRKRANPVIAKVTRAHLMMDESGLFVLFHGKAVDLKTHREQSHPQGPYLVLAKMYYRDDGSTTNPKTFCWCSCSDFKFRCEVALALRGSSAIISSNGALPHTTNPTATPRLCKHSLAFLEKALHQFKTRDDFPEGKPKMSKSDRELVEQLTKPRNTKANLRRMFPEQFKGIMPGTRF
jgi:hypothetical protein